ncbi:N-terminal nucleophile aminohydrolase [Calycina marina]|uniref:N-terminal nucleophile aminohydrolase n=1 Tax=Calycina marina TaxID=1763456 RepID=A0A9P8CF24_9HELO|nr:N-terminal nucleophile aminohydrolase [Calycina marina]
MSLGSSINGIICRWFVYISGTEPCLLEDVLVHDHYLPLLLSHDLTVHAQPTTVAEITTGNRLFNIDGFGCVWYTPIVADFASPGSASTLTKPSLYPALYKTIQPPLHDANFRSICSNTASKVVLAHIRAATSTAIVPTNNHPFTFGCHSIMHNGYISNFRKIKLEMCKAMSEEAYTNIHGELKAALQKTINRIVRIQASTLSITPYEPNSLNVTVTDGRSLIAVRFRDHKTEQPPSLYYSTLAGVTLNRRFPDHPDGADGPHGKSNSDAKDDEQGKNLDTSKSRREHGNHVIIASEPTTYKNGEWTLIEKNRAVLVEDGSKVTVEAISYPGA